MDKIIKKGYYIIYSVTTGFFNSGKIDVKEIAEFSNSNEKEVEQNILIKDLNNKSKINAIGRYTIYNYGRYDYQPWWRQPLGEIDYRNYDKYDKAFKEFVKKELEEPLVVDVRNSRRSLVGGAKNKLENLTVKELQQRCIKRKIKYSGLLKADLIKALRK